MNIKENKNYKGSINMDIKENKNYNENKKLLKEICKKELSSVICFFEYDPKNNQCIARKLNSKDISKFKNFIKKIIKPYPNDNISVSKKISIGNNLTTSEIGIKYFHKEYKGKDFYFILDVKKLVNIRKKTEDNSDKKRGR